jgi:bacterial/archaeal transporter family-2 protein
LAGLTGAVAVFAGLAIIDKIGAGLVNGLNITANLLTSLPIDHFGLMNMPVHAMNVWRIIGAIDGRNCPHLPVLMSNQDGRFG